MTENIYNSLMSYEWDIINLHYLNRYVNFINSILEKRENKRFEHSERHHICPRALNGTDDADNLIYLSYREHFLAHYMLAKAFVNHSIVIALRKMMDGKDRINENSRLYEESKILVNDAMSVLFSGEGNPFYGKTHTTEIRQKLRELSTGKYWTDEQKKMMSERVKGENHPNWGKHLSEETKRHISEAKKGKSIHRTEEQLKQFSEILKKAKQKQYTESTYMNNGNIVKLVQNNEIQKYLNDGYIIGRLPLIEETKQKISENAKERYKDKSNIYFIGTKWINNGQISKMVKESELKYYLSNGYKLGRIVTNKLETAIRKPKYTNKNTKVMNNGTNIVYVPIDKIDYYLSLGYKLGNIKSPNVKGSKMMNNGINNKFVKPDEIDYYLSNGYVFGKIKKN